jgi:hypothetical protein
MSTRQLRCMALGLCLSAVALSASPSASQTGAPPLVAFAPCDWGSDDCSPCVPDAVAAVNRLRSHGDIMGFHMNGAPDVTNSKHWQGVQRLMAGGGRYLAISRSLPDEDTDVSFVVVDMASRDTGGRRFRSNRLDPDRFFELTPPPLEDGVAVVVPHEPGFDHAGGMQLAGNILAVPFEGGGASKVVLYDLTTPLAPVRLANEVDHTSLADEAGTASLVKLGDGRFLLIIGRADANILDLYVSRSTDIRTTAFDRFDTWSEDELVSEICDEDDEDDCDEEFGNYQNLNLLPQCDGSLYLVGTHKNLLTSQDFVDLFRVENAPGADVRIVKVAKQHLTCGYAGVNHCNLDAAGGLYVDPAGELLLYGTEHDNDGPLDVDASCSGPPCSVKLEEFRPVPHSTCDRSSDAWVELYDDRDFGDRSLMIDFVDRAREDYRNYDRAEGFEDKASSVRWCLPVGTTYRLWQDKEPCGGSYLELPGTGQLEAIGDLDDVGFGDETSCSEWLGGPFADAGHDRQVECTSATGTAVQLDGRGSVENDSVLAFYWSAPGVTFDDPYSPTPTGAFPSGTTRVTLTLTDDVGDSTDTDTVLVEVVDTTPPVIAAGFALSPAVLRPPNRRLIAMDVSPVIALEACDPAPAFQCDVTSSEPADAPKYDGRTRFDIVFDGEQILTQGTGARTISSNGNAGFFTLKLRAERALRGDGRTYRASCFATDASGNVGAPAVATVEVPLRRR